MTPDERQLLTRFLADLTQARADQKDPEAARLIAQAINANPDAPYLLVQHTVMADQALLTAQARIAELEAQQRGEARSFFRGPSGVPPRPAYAPSPEQPYPSQPGYAPPPFEARPGPFAAGGGLGSFLQSAGATAAGVAGGEMLFRGLSGLFGGHHGGLFGGGAMAAPQETIVNNYYDDQPDDGGWSNGDDDDGSSDY